MVSTSFPGQLGPWSEGSRCRTSFTGITRPCSRACGVDQLSRETRLQLVREVPRTRPAVPSNSGLGLWPLGVNQLSWELVHVSHGPQGRTAVPGDTGTWPSALNVDQLLRATQSRVQGPTGSSSCPRRLMLGPVREVPRGRSAAHGDRSPGTRARGVDQLSHVARARVRRPAGSTSCTRQLTIGSEGPRG